MSWPSNSIRPWDLINPTSARKVEDFPAPLGPRRAITSPSLTTKLLPRTALTAPYETDKSVVDSRVLLIFIVEPLVRSLGLEQMFQTAYVRYF